MITEGMLTDDQREHFQRDFVLSGLDPNNEKAVMAFIRAWCEGNRIYLSVERLTPPDPR